MIIGKSTHPVLVKRISVRLWSLRDEIEAALANRVDECEAAGIPVYIDDIKDFYLPKSSEELPSNVTELNPTPQIVEAASSDMNLPTEETIQDQLTPPSTEEIKTAENETPTAENINDIANQVLENKHETPSKKQDEIIKRPLERTVPSSEKISFGFSLLSDINMDGMLLFSKNAYTFGQNVILEFLIPHKFTVSGEISYCQNITKNSRIISTTKPDYRIKIKFLFQMPNERANLRKFLKSIEPSVDASAPKAPSKKSDDVNLEDLDF